MKIKIISDIHLGVKNTSSNDFLIDENAFREYLSMSVHDNDLLILNGDTFELWEEILNSGSLSARMTNIINSWNFMDIILNDPKIKIINGNHDAFIKRPGIIPTKYVTDSLDYNMNGYKIHIAHGHQGDIWNKDSSCLKYISCCCKNLESVGEDMVDYSLDDSVQKLTNCLFPDNGKTEKYAEALANATNTDIIVFGHTHTSNLVEKSNCIYVNDGCCVNTQSIDELIIQNGSSLNISLGKYDFTTGIATNSKTINKI